MRVKLDDNLPISLADRLATRGIDAETAVGEGLGGRSDAELLDIAVAEDRLIITLDRGFGGIRRYRRQVTRGSSSFGWMTSPRRRLSPL